MRAILILILYLCGKIWRHMEKRKTALNDNEKIEPYNPNEYETRFRLVNKDTGEIIDDAQGYGYRTVQGCYKAMYYKRNRGTIKSDEKKARGLIKQHKRIYKSAIEEVNSLLFEDCRDGFHRPKKEYLDMFSDEIKKSDEELWKSLSETDIELIYKYIKN